MIVLFYGIYFKQVVVLLLYYVIYTLSENWGCLMLNVMCND